MKGKIKKIIVTSIISATALTAVGCSGTNGNKLAKNIDKSMSDFVSSINNLDYVESGKPVNDKIGKLVETNATAYAGETRNVINENNQIKFLNENVSEAEIENTITSPSERQGDFKLYVLSESPFVTLTSDDNNASLSFNVQFSTNKIEQTSSEIDSKINKLILKRSILMIYVNEIYSGNVNLSEENKTAINAYVNVIKENTSFLNGNRGMVKNQLKLASNLVENQSNGNLVNYYIIKSGEALENRASKLDSTISAIDAITKIIEDNLTNSSPYYSSKLSGTYDKLLSNVSNKEQDKTDQNTIHTQIAESISNSLKFILPEKTEDEKTKTNNPNEGIMLLPSFDMNNPIQDKNEPIMSTYPAHRNDKFLDHNPADDKNINSNNGIFNNTQNNTNNNNTSKDKVIQPRTNNLNRKTTKRRPYAKKVQNNQNIGVNSAQNHSNTENFMTSEQNINSTSKMENDDKNDTNKNIFNKKVMNLMQHIPNTEESKTIRAERNPERTQKEEYTSASVNSEDYVRAEHVPFKSSNAKRS